MKLIGSRVFFDQLWQQTCKNKKTRLLCKIKYSVLSSKSAQNWYYTLYVCTVFFFQLSWNITNLRLSEWVAIERIPVLELLLQIPEIPAGPGVHHDNHETSTNSWYSDGCESNTLVSTPGWTYGSPYEDVWHYLGPWICKTLQTCEPTACRTAKTSVALPLLAVAIISKGNKSAKQRDVWRCLEAQRPKVTVQASNYQRYWP